MASLAMLSGNVKAHLGDRGRAYAVDRDVVDGVLGRPRHRRKVAIEMWNARTAPAGMIEVIAPAGFERFFREFVETTAMGAPDPAEIGRLATGALPAAAG